MAPREQVVTSTSAAVAEDQRGSRCTCHTSQQPQVSCEKCKSSLGGEMKIISLAGAVSLQLERPVPFSPEKRYQHTRPALMFSALQCRLARAHGLLVALYRDSFCLILLTILRGCFWSGSTGKNTLCRQNREQSVCALAEGIFSRKYVPLSNSD